MLCAELKHLVVHTSARSAHRSAGNNSSAPNQSHGKPGPRGPGLLPHSPLLSNADSTGLPFFCVHLFQDLDLHGLVGHQPLQAPALLFQGSEPPRFVHFHPAKLALPSVIGLHPKIVLAQVATTVAPARTSVNITIFSSSLNRLFFMLF